MSEPRVSLGDLVRILIPAFLAAWCVFPGAAQTVPTDAFSQRAAAAEARGDFETAIHELREAIRIDPRDPSLHTALGAAFFQDSYLADAIREFRAALALRPDDPDARANLAAAWIRLGDPQDAFPELERLAALDANDRQVHSDLGLCYLESGRWREAAREYTLLLKSDPGSPELLYNLAVTQKHLDDLAAARALLLKCLQLQPDFPAAELELGEALWQEGMLEEAAEHLRSLCAAHPDFLPAYFPLAEVLRQKGDVQGALAATQAVLKANPQSASAYQELAILEQQRGNVDAAAAAFHQAEKFKNESKVRQAAHVATGSALRLLRAGKSEDAARKLEFALRLDPDSAEAHYHLAVLLGARGEEAQSLAEFQKAYALDARLKPPHRP